MKFWKVTTLWIVLILIFSACGAKPTPKKEAIIDKSLPMVQLTSKGIIVGMNSIAFEWKSITDYRVKGLYIYKKFPSVDATPNKLQYLTTIDSRFKTHFVDTDVSPDQKYIYAFQTFSDEADGKRGKSTVVNTLPVLSSVSWIHSITGMPRVAKIIWRPHSNEKVKEYIVERKTLEDEGWEKLAVVHGRLSAEYIDENLHDNYVYMYRVRVVTYDGITSSPSKIVKVITKALPKSITNIKATKNLPKHIDISWNKSTMKDFERYYLYRSESVDGSYELIAKLYNNRFSDKIDADGKVYFYRVSCVDKDGLESEYDKNSVQGMTLIRPKAPAIVEAKHYGDTIEIHWSKTDPRSVTYNIIRHHKQGWFKENVKEITGIKAQKFVDKNIQADSTYTYVVQSVDKNKIVSKKSMEVKIVTPESSEIQKAPVTKQTQKSVETVVQPVMDDMEGSKDIISAPQDLDLSGL